MAAENEHENETEGTRRVEEGAAGREGNAEGNRDGVGDGDGVGEGEGEGDSGIREPGLRPGASEETYFMSVGAVGPLVGEVPVDALSNVSRNFAIKGVLFVVVGVVAILFPVIFGLAVEQLLAWLLVLGGGITLVQFFMVCGQSGTASFLFLGALHFIVGLWLLLRPIQGLAALTLVLSGWFIVHGILKLVLSCQLCHLTTWPAVLISGLISIALGVTIVALTPKYGLTIVGIVFGADLLSTGVAVLLISLMAYIARRRRPHSDDTEAAREPLLDGDSNAAAAST